MDDMVCIKKTKAKILAVLPIVCIFGIFSDVSIAFSQVPIYNFFALSLDLSPSAYRPPALCPQVTENVRLRFAREDLTALRGELAALRDRPPAPPAAAAKDPPASAPALLCRRTPTWTLLFLVGNDHVLICFWKSVVFLLISCSDLEPVAGIRRSPWRA